MKSNDNFSVSLALKLTGDKSVLWIVQLSDILFHACTNTATDNFKIVIGGKHFFTR